MDNKQLTDIEAAEFDAIIDDFIERETQDTGELDAPVFYETVEAIFQNRTEATPIPCNLALKIAHADAEKAYRDLSGYRITVALEPDGWHVDYDLKDPRLKGGGPHYVIDSASGEISFKRYEQ